MGETHVNGLNFTIFLSNSCMNFEVFEFFWTFKKYKLIFLLKKYQFLEIFIGNQNPKRKLIYVWELGTNLQENKK